MGFLESRLMDFIFSFFFFIFVLSNVFVEVPICLGEPVLPTSTYPMVAESYHWGMKADRIWVEQPHWSRVAVCYHCFGFGIFYALFCIGFLFRWNWIQKWGLIVGGAKLAVGAFYMTTNLLHPEFPPAEPVLFVVQSMSYMAIPFLLIVRMWNENPFTHRVKYKHY